MSNEIDLRVAYLLFVFFSCVGTLQIAACHSRISMMLFVMKNRTISLLLGLIIILVSFLWFFLPAPHNINDIHGGLDANDQFLLFSIGGLSALLFTLIVSSVLNSGKGMKKHHQPLDGLDGLKEITYWQAFRLWFDALWTYSKKLIHSCFSG
jgi:hypothetical protein